LAGSAAANTAEPGIGINGNDPQSNVITNTNLTQTELISPSSSQYRRFAPHHAAENRRSLGDKYVPRSLAYLGTIRDARTISGSAATIGLVHLQHRLPRSLSVLKQTGRKKSDWLDQLLLEDQ